ncbi:hypothetical protein MANES_14G138100v8 [Manihot esculenta]|uniref:Uncharacterized protein n=1 Tax=Manihot esculenta TaxID=3983 RepID=A0ACB7GGE7_MANES|nr:hypothetical protein MANES_14G138100v8 [Manihot esculenta]
MDPIFFIQVEDHPDEILLNSEKHCDSITNEIWNLAEESSFPSGIGTSSTSSVAETGASLGSSITASEGTSTEEGLRNNGTSNQGKGFSEGGELVAPSQVSDYYSHDESCRHRSITEASTSFKDQQSSDPVSVNVLSNEDAVNGIDNSEDMGGSYICRDIMHPSSSFQGLGDAYADGVSIENHMAEATGVFNSDSDSVPHRTEVPVTFDSLGDESVPEAIPAGLGFLVADREQGTEDGGVIHVDVVSISSSIFSSSNADMRGRDARRNSRRLFWDAFSRRSSRRHLDSPTIFFSAENSDDLLSHERWLLDFSGDFFDDGMGGDSGYLGSRIHSLNGRRRHSRSEMWERLRGGFNEQGRGTTLCPSGLHPDGTCSCDSSPTTEESSNRASISRIVMLAEALFEVLDEIHRQPVSLSLSMVSLPAPESVVDSFPLKNHKKEDKVGGSDDVEVEQCYICLSEYEEGDKIRVLPCHHEYHMSCVDKWLKEIHGVCPLCRGDVRQGANESSVSGNEFSVTNPEIPYI